MDKLIVVSKTQLKPNHTHIYVGRGSLFGFDGDFKEALHQAIQSKDRHVCDCLNTIYKAIKLNMKVQLFYLTEQEKENAEYIKQLIESKF